MDGDSVTFIFDLTEPLEAHLVVRCDARGDVYVAIPPDLRRPPYPFITGE